MKFSDVYKLVESKSNMPSEGEGIAFVLNEEYAINADIVACEDSNIYVGVDQKAFNILKAAGLLRKA